MDIKINAEQGVPIVITESIVKRPQVIKRKKVFRGFSEGLINLVSSFSEWAMEQIEASFFDEKIEVVDAGLKEQKHFAITIGSDGYEPTLQAIEVLYKPPCVHHYEIIRYEQEQEEKLDFLKSGAVRQAKAEMPEPPSKRSETLEELRRKLGNPYESEDDV